MINQAEYIWLDGAKPTKTLRSKTRIVDFNTKSPQIADFPVWNFDGSSTEQATGKNSDCILQPVNFVSDPIRGAGNYLVMCEVLKPDESIHETNTRARLRAVLDAGAARAEAWFGFEQEYTLFQNGKPLGWPESGYPAPQGPYYCGVGSNRVFGRELVEEHTKACIDAGLMIYGINAEVMLSQWEFQIGYRGIKNEIADALTTSDHLWFGRWLMARLGEKYGIEVSLAPKPVSGDWNGTGCHTNFSTKAMREDNGIKAIQGAVKKLETRHADHIAAYGYGNEQRLTGHHETCHISQFRCGELDRGASIRIPVNVSKQGFGYLEDRRPAANCDPYEVTRMLLETICDLNAGAQPSRLHDNSILLNAS